MSYLRNGLSLIVDSLNQNAHFLMPLVISKAVEINLQDYRIGKIVFGVGLTISGLNLMIANKVSSILKSWYWTNIDMENKEDNTSETVRWLTITLGFVIASYGIFNITTGILELTSNEGSSANMCAVQLLKAKERFLSCPEGLKLWDKVNSEGSFTIRFVTKNEAPTGACVFTE